MSLLFRLFQSFCIKRCTVFTVHAVYNFTLLCVQFASVGMFGSVCCLLPNKPNLRQVDTIKEVRKCIVLCMHLDLVQMPTADSVIYSFW